MGKPVPVVITVYKDKKFDFIIKTPPASHYIREAAKLKSGSKEPGRNIIGSISKQQLKDIAEKKMDGKKSRPPKTKAKKKPFPKTFRVPCRCSPIERTNFICTYLP